MKAAAQVSGLDLLSGLFKAYTDLASAAGELATKHIYLDPRDPADDLSARSYCALCMRYGLNCRAIDHAESCLVGRTIRCLDGIRAQLQQDFISVGFSEGTLADGGEAVAEQEGAAAAGPVRAPERFEAAWSRIAMPTGKLEVVEPVGASGGRSVEYIAERRRRNPYANPCAGVRGGIVCEMESGHSGAHCADGAVWADDGLIWGDGAWRQA